jgi:hypothetical protein
MACDGDPDGYDGSDKAYMLTFCHMKRLVCCHGAKDDYS